MRSLKDTLGLRPEPAEPARSPSEGRLAVDSITPASTRSPTPFPVWRSPETHAQRLAEWLTDHRCGEILSREIQAAYREMCAEIGWELSGWNRVAPRFRELIGDRKHYRDFVVDGRRHRWCVYTLPRRLGIDPAAVSDRLAAGSEEDRAPLAA